jgi:hypothetical protein
MPKISDLKLLLYRVNARLTEHPVFTRGTGVPVDDPAHDRENAELGRLSLQLSLIARELNSKSNLLSIREKTTRSMSQSDRYRATASIRDQQAEISEVLALAKELQARLEGMIRKSCSIGDGELAQGIGDFIEKITRCREITVWQLRCNTTPFTSHHQATRSSSSQASESR